MYEALVWSFEKNITFFFMISFKFVTDEKTKTIMDRHDIYVSFHYHEISAIVGLCSWSYISVI